MQEYKERHQSAIKFLKEQTELQSQLKDQEIAELRQKLEEANTELKLLQQKLVAKTESASSKRQIAHLKATAE